MPFKKDHPRFSKEEYDRRYREIRKRMEEKGIDVLILYGEIFSDELRLIIKVGAFSTLQETERWGCWHSDPTCR
jgi:DNA-binding sugar fermentation-stimulating protein